MRVITREAVHALIRGHKYYNDNTYVRVFSNGNRELCLHDNRIVWYDKGKYYLSLCGWNTNTTRDRLNGFLFTIGAHAKIVTRKYVPYIQYNDGRKVQISGRATLSFNDDDDELIVASFDPNYRG